MLCVLRASVRRLALCIIALIFGRGMGVLHGGWGRRACLVFHLGVGPCMCVGAGGGEAVREESMFDELATSSPRLRFGVLLLRLVFLVVSLIGSLF